MPRPCPCLTVPLLSTLATLHRVLRDQEGLKASTDAPHEGRREGEQVVCDVDLSHTDGTLTLHFELRTPEIALWNVWFVIGAVTVPVLSVPVGAIGWTISISIPEMPEFGRIGVLTTLTTTQGITAADWATIDTGTPELAPTP